MRLLYHFCSLVSTNNPPFGAILWYNVEVKFYEIRFERLFGDTRRDLALSLLDGAFVGIARNARDVCLAHPLCRALTHPCREGAFQAVGAKLGDDTILGHADGAYRLPPLGRP